MADWAEATGTLLATDIRSWILANGYNTTGPSVFRGERYKFAGVEVNLRQAGLAIIESVWQLSLPSLWAYFEVPGGGGKDCQTKKTLGKIMRAKSQNEARGSLTEKEMKRENKAIHIFEEPVLSGVWRKTSPVQNNPFILPLYLPLACSLKKGAGPRSAYAATAPEGSKCRAQDQRSRIRSGLLGV